MLHKKTVFKSSFSSRKYLFLKCFAAYLQLWTNIAASAYVLDQRTYSIRMIYFYRREFAICFKQRLCHTSGEKYNLFHRNELSAGSIWQAQNLPVGKLKPSVECWQRQPVAGPLAEVLQPAVTWNKDLVKIKKLLIAATGHTSQTCYKTCSTATYLAPMNFIIKPI